MRLFVVLIGFGWLLKVNYRKQVLVRLVYNREIGDIRDFVINHN